MIADSLSPLQHRVLRLLAPLTPSWTLTGGAALAGVYLGHRTTRDLDLFWRSRAALGTLVSEAQALLRTDGLDCTVLRTAPAFGELRVSDGAEVCVVDLVAEPFGPVNAPRTAVVGGVSIVVDTLHEILVSKLTALLGRAEIRDLVDVQAILNAGGDLATALRDAPRKDAGFSALTLAWVLQSLSVGPLAEALGWSTDRATALDAFRRELIGRLTGLTRPE